MLLGFITAEPQWELPYATGAALKSKKKKKTTTEITQEKVWTTLFLTKLQAFNIH